MPILTPLGGTLEEGPGDVGNAFGELEIVEVGIEELGAGAAEAVIVVYAARIALINRVLQTDGVRDLRSFTVGKTLSKIFV